MSSALLDSLQVAIGAREVRVVAGETARADIALPSDAAVRAALAEAEQVPTTESVDTRTGGLLLTGTASVFRAYALKAVADSRGELLPGDPGHVYDTLAMTEDNEMTLALKTATLGSILCMVFALVASLAVWFAAAIAGAY